MKKDLEFKAIEFDPFASRGELERSAPATEGQNEIWTSLAMSPIATLAYNESLAMRIETQLDPERLERAFALLIAKHDALRSSFSPLGRSLLVAKDLKINMERIDLSNDLMSDRIKTWEKLRADATREAFASDGPLIRVCLIKFSLNESRLLITAHHLVCDGWSLAIILKDLAKAYSESQLADAPSFADYAERESTANTDAAREYWKGVYKDSGTVLELPISKARPPIRGFQSRRIDRIVPQTLVEGLKALARGQRTSYVTLQLSAFAILLGRLSESRDLSIGMPSAGQASEGLDRLIGHCVQLLPMRIKLHEGESFLDLLARNKTAMLDAYDHKNFTFGEILKSLKIARDPSRIPLVSVMFNVDSKLEPEDLRFDGIPATYESNPRFAENFELFVNISESKTESIIECQYNSGLFTSDRIELILDSYIHLLEGLVLKSEAAYDSLAISNAKTQLQTKWNATKKDYPREKSLVDLLRNACIHNGSRIAIEAVDGKLSYAELWEESGKLSARLSSLGIGAGDRVGLCLNRTTRMIVAQIGILRAGASYVPLDPSFPSDRIDYMVHDADLKSIVCEEASKALLPVKHAKIIWEEKFESSSSSDRIISAEAPAYMIYTSGSTGRPKGVVISHRAVVNFLLMMTDRLVYKNHARLLAVTTLSFDIAVLEIFMPLLNRGTVILASEETRKDGFALAKVLESEKIDVMQATPSTWRMLLSLDWKPKSSLCILCGGEAFPADLKKELLPSAGAVWNLYGPTEATVWVTAKQLKISDASVTVGRPIGNVRIHILDKNKHILPQGIRGEVYLAGDALADGYWRRPELDAEKFMILNDAEERVYQTGDIGMINADGELEIMGRADSQIKLRGYRIELGEIENILLESPYLREATVVFNKENPENPQIQAFIVWSEGDRLNELRREMSRHLPDYMIPQTFIPMDQLPLLPNGKINRKAMAESSEEKESTAESIREIETLIVDVEQTPRPEQTPKIEQAPRVETLPEVKSEADPKMLQLWMSTLGRKEIAADDDFFLIGGHSLLAIQLLAKVNREFQCQLTLRDIFLYPKLGAFSQFVLSQSKAEDKAIPAARSKRLSFAQERMWYVEQLNPGPVHNLPGAWLLHGSFDYAAWKKALDALLQKHEALSFAVDLEAGAPVRSKTSLKAMDCPFVDLSSLLATEAKAKAIDLMETAAMTAFDLSRSPLVQFAVYKIAKDQHIAFINAHHMVWDGWSFDLFWSQVHDYYRQALVGEIPVQTQLSPNYSDFSDWQRSEVSSKGSSSQYWTEIFADLPDALDLPIDYPRPARLEAEADTVLAPWSKEGYLTFEQQSKDMGSTPFMLALTMLVLTLHRLSGQNDIVIGTPVRGRTRSEFEAQLGLFINVLPLRFRIDPSQTFASLLRQVQKVCTEGFAHQDYPFESLLSEVKASRDESRTPLFTAMFSYQDVSERSLEMPGLKMEQIFVGGQGIPTDIVFWIKKSSNSLDMGIDFRSKLWNRDSVLSFAEIIKSLQKQSAADPSQPIDAYSLLPAEQMPRIKPASVHAWAGPIENTLQSALWKALADNPLARIRSGHDSYSYEGIARKAVGIAIDLRSRGVQKGDRVGLCSDRSIALIPAMFGIMLSGAAYVPLDPNLPRERIQSMCDQADLKCIVTQEDWLDVLPIDPKNCLLLSDLRAVDDASFDTFQANRPLVEAKDPAYVIFTSGSTGIPKAVQISQGAAIHFLEGIQKTLELRSKDNCLALTTITFDISVLEIFGPILRGATLILAESAYAADGESLGRLIQNEKITFMQATASGYRILLDSSWKGSKDLRAIVGGEALPRDILDRLLPKVKKLWNAYGPTEATVWATLEEMTDVGEAAITIGRPLPGYETFILNAKRQLQPIGSWGELYIGGPALADGYLKDPIKTAERFIAHSLAAKGRLYATGDIVRLRSDGRLEFKARLDTQVKIRGHRIELEDIESLVAKDPRVRAAAAKVWELNAGDQRLVLYVVSDEALNLVNLQTVFRQSLPKYMWPNHVEQVPSLPMTSNIKLNRNALRRPDFSQGLSERKTLRIAASPSEKALASIWQDLLHVNEVSLDDNFFDLGGHSLLTLQMLARINESFGRNLKLRDVLTATLGQLANLVATEERA